MMTREEQVQCIVDNLDAFKKALLAKAYETRPTGMAMEIRQWVMDCAKDAWVFEMDKRRTAPIQDGEADLRAVGL